MAVRVYVVREIERDFSGVDNFNALTWFPPNCKFNDSTTFGQKCYFSQGCIFGKDCDFAFGQAFNGDNDEANFIFEQNCHFGKACKIGSNSILTGCILSSEMKVGSNCQLLDCRFSELEDCRGVRFGNNCRFSARGVMHFPSDSAFGNNNIFLSKMVFLDAIIFGNNNSFRQDCEIGNGCTMGNNNNFYKNCKFGGLCVCGNNDNFLSICEFGDKNEFGNNCSIADGSTFGKSCILGNNCNVGDSFAYGIFARVGNNLEGRVKIIKRRSVGRDGDSNDENSGGIRNGDSSITCNNHAAISGVNMSHAVGTEIDTNNTNNTFASDNSDLKEKEKEKDKEKEKEKEKENENEQEKRKDSCKDESKEDKGKEGKSGSIFSDETLGVRCFSGGTSLTLVAAPDLVGVIVAKISNAVKNPTALRVGEKIVGVSVGQALLPIHYFKSSDECFGYFDKLASNLNGHGLLQIWTQGALPQSWPFKIELDDSKENEYYYYINKYIKSINDRNEASARLTQDLARSTSSIGNQNDEFEKDRRCMPYFESLYKSSDLQGLDKNDCSKDAFGYRSFDLVAQPAQPYRPVRGSNANGSAAQNRFNP